MLNDWDYVGWGHYYRKFPLSEAWKEFIISIIIPATAGVYQISSVCQGMRI